MPAAPVVCALDASPASQPALRAAAALSERSGAPLHLVTVRPPAEADVYRAASDPEATTRAVVEVTVDRELGAGSCARLVAEIHTVRDTDAAGALVTTAAGVGAAVLVLGTHGRRGLQRFRLGSVAEAVVRDAPCPVLVAPAGSAGRMPGPDHPVLVAVDFSEASARALTAGQWLAGLYGARLGAVHVRTSGTQDASDVQAFAATHGAPDAHVHLIAASDAADGLIVHAESLGAGAVAMGTQGRRGLAHVVFGSVAEACVRGLPCPVLVVR